METEELLSDVVRGARAAQEGAARGRVGVAMPTVATAAAGAAASAAAAAARRRVDDVVVVRVRFVVVGLLGRLALHRVAATHLPPFPVRVLGHVNFIR